MEEADPSAVRDFHIYAPEQLDRVRANLRAAGAPPERIAGAVQLLAWLANLTFQQFIEPRDQRAEILPILEERLRRVVQARLCLFRAPRPTQFIGRMVADEWYPAEPGQAFLSRNIDGVNIRRALRREEATLRSQLREAQRIVRNRPRDDALHFFVEGCAQAYETATRKPATVINRGGGRGGAFREFVRVALPWALFGDPPAKGASAANRGSDCRVWVKRQLTECHAPPDGIIVTVLKRRRTRGQGIRFVL